MDMTTHKGPTAYETLDKFLEAEMSNELRELFKMPRNPAKEINNPTSAPADAPTGGRPTEAERLVPENNPTDAPTDAPT